MASEPGCHTARTAPQIGDRRTVFSLLGKAGQHSSVERLSGELIAEAPHVLLGDGVGLRTLACPARIAQEWLIGVVR